MYGDVVAAIDELAIPMRKLSALYEAGSRALDDAVHVDPVSGATNVDRDGFRSHVAFQGAGFVNCYRAGGHDFTGHSALDVDVGHPDPPKTLNV